jgi:CheY-like chemotaxis protein
VKFDHQSASNRGSSKASLYAVKQLRKIQLEENAAAGWPLALRLQLFREVTDENTSTSHTIKYPHWQREFEAALREGDPQSLRRRVDAAEAALFLRLQALAESAGGDEERRAIADAIGILRAIQKDKLGYPDWNTKWQPVCLCMHPISAIVAWSMLAKRILVVDDNAVVRTLVRKLFESQSDFEISGEAENGRDAVDKAEKLKPDLIILDLIMPVMTGLDAAPLLKQLLPNTPIILFTQQEGSEVERQARAVGIDAVVSKTQVASELVLKAQSLFASIEREHDPAKFRNAS